MSSDLKCDREIAHGGSQSQSGNGIQVGHSAKISGGIGNRKTRNTSIRIGNINLGPWQLVLGAAILLGGGGTAAVVAHSADAPSAVVQEAVGTWKISGKQTAGNLTVTAGTLTISSEATYQMGMTASLNVTNTNIPDPPMPNTQSSGSCAGEVTSRERLLVFTPFDRSGACRTFTGSVSADAMTLGDGGDAIKFRRA